MHTTHAWLMAYPLSLLLAACSLSPFLRCDSNDSSVKAGGGWPWQLEVAPFKLGDARQAAGLTADG